MATLTRDAGRSRRAILDAAERLFALAGFEGVSLAEIGAAAGVSRGLPAYLFGNKQDLYQATIDRAAQRVRERIEKTIRPARPASLETTLDRFIAAYIDYLASSPALA